MTTSISHIDFAKMQAAGNDFVFINNLDEAFSKEKIIHLTPALCDRHFGIGADGVVVLQPPQLDEVDCTMLYRNADGSDAGMCGNGARCFALFAQRAGFDKDELIFNVHDSIYKATFMAENQIKITFPIQTEVNEVVVEGETMLQIFTGTEHIVKKLSALDLKNGDLIKKQGRTLRNADVFRPKGTNVNFIHPLSKNTLFLRTYERGVEDLTLACGTGSIASAVAWHYLQDPENTCHHSTIIQTDGGTLQIGFEYHKESDTYSGLTLTGEAHFVFDGNYEV